MKITILLMLTLTVLTARADEGETSRTFRGAKTWGWTGDLGMLTVGNINTFGWGAGVSYFLSENDVLMADLSASTNYDFFSSIGGDTVNAYSNRQGVYYKRYVSNSFYLKGGLTTDEIHYRVTHYPLLGGSSYRQSASINLYSLFFGVGNQWQFRKFTIGCDWAAITIPLFSSGYSESDDGPVYNEWDLKDRLTKVGGTFGRLSLGMSF